MSLEGEITEEDVDTFKNNWCRDTKPDRGQGRTRYLVDAAIVRTNSLDIVAWHSHKSNLEKLSALFSLLQNVPINNPKMSLVRYYSDTESHTIGCRKIML